jgi:hypothetical protein
VLIYPWSISQSSLTYSSDNIPQHLASCLQDTTANDAAEFHQPPAKRRKLGKLEPSFAEIDLTDRILLYRIDFQLVCTNC